MADWSATTLSTLQSISDYESEINDLAGEFTANGLSAAIDNTVTFGTNVFTAASAIHSDGTVNAMVRVGSTAAYKFSVATTATSVIIAIQGTTATGVFSFPILQSSGTISDTSLTYTVSITTGTAFTTYAAQNSWTAKITKAKKLIGNRIEESLTDRNIHVSESSGQVLLDIVANPEIFSDCSDFLSLSLIYHDLYSQRFTDTYEKSYLYYEKQFNAEFASCLKRLNLDWDLSGDTDTYRADFIGRLER